MKIITNNPYRVIGLLADCTERDIQRQRGLIKRFLDIGKEITFDSDIILPVNCQRTADDIQHSFAKIEQATGRVTYGIFWFVQGNHVDEAALNYLRDGNSDKATEIWSKVARNDVEITSKNAFAFHNLSTLKLGLAFYDKQIDKILFEEGVLLKSKLLCSNNFTEIINRISDKTFNSDQEVICQTFVDEILLNIDSLIDREDGISSVEIVSVFKKAPNSIRNYIAKKFIEKPLHAIENAIEESSSKRKANKANSFRIALKLSSDTTRQFELLQSVSGKNSLQYSMLSDKVADEYLRCSNDYFNAFRDSEEDPGDKSLKITRLAELRAVGSKMKERVQKDIDELLEWNKDKPFREKKRKIKSEYDLISSLLDEYDERPQTIANAKRLVSESMSPLQKIKLALGATDELYLNMSSRVGSDAQSMVVSEINKAQDDFIKKIENGRLSATSAYIDKNAVIQQMRTKFEEAWNVALLIGKLDMNSDFRKRYADNKTTLQGLCNQMGVSTISYQQPTTPRPAPANTGNNTGSNNDSGAKVIVWIIIIIVFFIVVKSCNS